MKKMILLVSMLAGVMTFSGCVDDKESASVTAVREAKAAQLSALAALSNAQAANQQALADTENALREAKVAYETAKAAYQQALADKANSEAQAAAAIQMAAAQNEIQRLANELEEMAIRHKIAMLDLQTQYEAALKKADDDSQALLGGLYMAYQTAATNLLNAQQEIAQQKIDLAKLQAGLVDSDEAKQIMINKENRKIASAEQTIAEWKAKLEVFEAQKAPEEAKAELVTEKAALSQLAQDKAKALEAADKAREEMNDAWSDIYDQKYHGLAMDVTGGKYGNFVDEEGNPTGEAFGDFIYLQDYEENALGKPVEATVNTYWFRTTDDKGNTTYTAVMNRMIQKTVTKTETTAPGVESTNTYEAYPTYYYQLNAEGVKAYVAAIKANVTKNEGKALEAANKALAAQQKVVADLEKAEIKDEAAIEEAKSMLPGLQTDVNTAKAALDKANAQVAAIQTAFDTMAAEAANWTVTIEAYNAASEAYCDAQFVYEKAEDAYGLQDAKVYALDAVVRGNVIVDGINMTFDQAIEHAEREIANAINTISDAKQGIANIEIAEADQLKALAIERLEAEIAIAEAEIPALEKIVADTKAALDAATAAQAE
ncbi:hypothetical protein NF347_00205 [Paramuribaculum intestinale]|uniref:hypothetical protein n=1 Tax=Paramuribaculum intestinale TaxID=2094151 RepID=UPI000D1EDD0A|nr:hypothetical protein [Paramuribaculum intestinale]PWB04079.1 hypothetical protein C5O24_12075 [Paramuribaculum intestinale]WLT42020.1 hypothetical protein NF347_00205 [Paramuribaculum intestinale]